MFKKITILVGKLIKNNYLFLFTNYAKFNDILWDKIRINAKLYLNYLSDYTFI